MVFLANTSCTPEAEVLVGQWKGTCECDFPAHSSVKVPRKPFAVEYTFTADDQCIRKEPVTNSVPRTDTTVYEVKDGMISWDHGNEASEELDVQWDGGIVLTYDNGNGGACRTELQKVTPWAIAPRPTPVQRRTALFANTSRMQHYMR